MRIRQYLYYWLPTRLPQSIKRILRVSVPRSLLKRYNPLQDPNYQWALHGSLSSYVFKIPTGGAQYVVAPYEPRVCAAIRRIVQPGMVCADIGAHFGYMTLLLAKCTGPLGQVYAFEAHPSNVKQLRENIRINSLSNRVIIENLAVSDQGSRRVALYNRSSSFEFSLLPPTSHVAGIEVPAIALDAYFDKEAHLDFVKMDIEGAEAQAIAGMSWLLHNQRPICLIEIHGQPGLSVLPELLSAGYALFDLNERPIDITPGSVPISHIIARPVENKR